jgi:predicted metalloprotease with PDZ domain
MHLFRPDPTPAYWTSRIAIGYFDIRRLPVGGTELRVAAIGGLDQRQRDKLDTWLNESSEAVAGVYGQFPRDTPQILIVPIGNRGSAIPWAHVVRGGGVAVEFFVDQNRTLEELRQDWTATHELSHLLLPYVSRRDRWLSEGIATYYQNILRARDGRLSEQQAWQKLHSGFERGRAATRGDTLAEATRSGRQSTMRIYWSGAAMMLQADAELRSLSHGRQSLDSALANLRECCLVSNRSWRARDLFSELDRITATSVFSDIYREHVTDVEFPDLSETFEQLGLVSDSGSIKLDPDASWGRIRFYIMNG